MPPLAEESDLTHALHSMRRWINCEYGHAQHGFLIPKALTRRTFCPEHAHRIQKRMETEALTIWSLGAYSEWQIVPFPRHFHTFASDPSCFLRLPTVTVRALHLLFNSAETAKRSQVIRSMQPVTENSSP